MMSAGTLTSFPHGPPACDVALCRLQEEVHRRWQADGLDGVGHGCWDCQLHQSHVVVHAGAVKGWVDDDPLDGDDQGPQPRPQHRPQAHSPVGWTRVTEQQQRKQHRQWVPGDVPRDISRTYLLKQCAAVISHLLWTSVAPQRWSFWYWRLPTQGHSPLRAVTPPTILWVPRAGRIPQSTEEPANKTNCFPPAQHMRSFTDSTLLQFCSSALLGQSRTPSHSGLIFLMQEVALHWKFPVQFIAGRQEVVTMKPDELYNFDWTRLLSVQCYQVAMEQPPHCWQRVWVGAEGRSFLLSGEAAQRRHTPSTHGPSRDRCGSESSCGAW